MNSTITASGTDLGTPTTGVGSTVDAGLRGGAATSTTGRSRTHLRAPLAAQAPPGAMSRDSDSLDISGFLRALFAFLIKYGSSQREQRWHELGAYTKEMKKVVSEMRDGARLRLIGGMLGAGIGIAGALMSLKALHVKAKTLKTDGLEHGAAPSDPSKRRASLHEQSAAQEEEALSLALDDESLVSQSTRPPAREHAHASSASRRGSTHSAASLDWDNESIDCASSTGSLLRSESSLSLTDRKSRSAQTSPADASAAKSCDTETADSFDKSARIQKASILGNIYLNLAQSTGKMVEGGFEFGAAGHDAEKTEHNAEAEIHQSKRQIANEDLETARSQASNAADVGNSLIHNRSFLVA